MGIEAEHAKALLQVHLTVVFAWPHCFVQAKAEDIIKVCEERHCTKPSCSVM